MNYNYNHTLKTNKLGENIYIYDYKDNYNHKYTYYYDYLHNYEYNHLNKHLFWKIQNKDLIIKLKIK